MDLSERTEMSPVIFQQFVASQKLESYVSAEEYCKSNSSVNTQQLVKAIAAQAEQR
jgi:hypothetical protein